ncbi:hypothetical protein [Hyphomonas johnsonii]|uniref:DUF3052 domain-containing protein n=1 Tax=Hyphomonas johnsonii MHS-2 TaxID=1280950 RepID=A0A059FJN0_9PROT|nr:hypothetical protein [Hyphomonas johnsonii]KCZ90741.1 hypothetical protein HJO_12856 [Hyphomonas johnsonii MHS-2]
MAETHGYSGKPLFQKLGLKPGMTCLPIGSPVEYETLVAGAEGVRFLKRAGAADLVHLFCPDRRTLDQKIGKAIGHVADRGMLWISWPKKSSKLFRDLTEDDLRTVILPMNWVDVKVCAVDADWSGLKFLRRKA